MTDKQIIQYAIEEGFAATEIVDTSDIVFDPSFRPYCEENLCGQYGANYSCTLVLLPDSSELAVYISMKPW